MDTGEFVPDYTVDCSEVVCNGADFVHIYSTVVSCVWSCVDYDGQTGVSLTMFFEKDAKGCFNETDHFLDPAADSCGNL